VNVRVGVLVNVCVGVMVATFVRVYVALAVCVGVAVAVMVAVAGGCATVTTPFQKPPDIINSELLCVPAPVCPAVPPMLKPPPVLNVAPPFETTLWLRS
jgi:hypothetical protein